VPLSPLRNGGPLYFSPPLEKGDKGGFEFVKSPLAPLFQRGESLGNPLFKTGEVE
jgi:hypothetical protein